MTVSQRPAEIANALNKKMEQLMPVLTPLGIAAGFLLPAVFIRVRPFITLLFGIITFSGALRLGVKELGQAIRRPLPILLCFAAAHLLVPLAARFVPALFFKNDPDIIAGFVLLYSAPTAVSGFIWTSIFRGNAALSLTLILLDTLLAPFVVPATLSLLVGARVNINMSGIAVSMLFMVVVPTILGICVNEISRGKVPDRAGPYLAPFSKLCLMATVAANTSPVVSKIHLADPGFWGIAALCIVLAAISYCIARGISIAGKLDPQKRVSVFFAGGLRNISAVTTIAVDFFAETAAVPGLLGIVFQQSMAVLMGRALLGNPQKQETAPFFSSK